MQKAVQIPASHLDLLIGAHPGVLTTLMPDGQPQSSLVWCDYDGECALVNTTLERQKGRNLRQDPRVSLLIVDPNDTTRYIGIRGQAELLTEGALEHLDRITRRFTRYPQYYGYTLPLERKARDTRVICRIHASRITLDAIHREKSSS
ncbi:MAG: PPOX class F420-dependent oxidoreductase [Anaerolineales bacterium]|jgi:PPOX class probable F420-dependent enzyme